MMDCRGQPACTNSRVLNPSVNREAKIIGVLRSVSFDYWDDGYTFLHGVFVVNLEVNGMIINTLKFIPKLYAMYAVLLDIIFVSSSSLNVPYD